MQLINQLYARCVEEKRNDNAWWAVEKEEVIVERLVRESEDRADEEF